MKKISLATATVILWGSVFLVANAAVHPLGTNIVAPDGTVFTITMENNQTVRRAYTSAGAFLSYSFNNWSTNVTSTPEDMALPVGSSFISPQEGKVFCSDRGADKGTCYLITSGQKAGFTSVNVFHGLGYSFDNVLHGDVSFLNNAPIISTSTKAHKPGTLVNKDGTIYLVGQNSLVGVPDPITLKSWGYDFADVVPANSADNSFTVQGILNGRKPEQMEILPVVSGGTAITTPVITPTRTSTTTLNHSTTNGGGGGGGSSAVTPSASGTTSNNTITAPELISGPASTQARAMTGFTFLAFLTPQTLPTLSVSYVVNWGDGNISSSTSTNPTGFYPPTGYAIYHTWATSGNYTINVNAIPASGSPTSATFQITINPSANSGSNPPTVTLTADPTAVTISVAQGKKDFTKVYVDSNSTQVINVEVVADSNSWLKLDGVLLNGSTAGSVYKGSPMDYYFWVYVDATNLQPNTYTAQITVNSSANTIKIPITLTVTQSSVDQTTGGQSSSSSNQNSAIRVGQLVALPTGSVVYVGSNGLYTFVDAAAFNSWGLNFSQVLTANSAEAALPQVGTIQIKKPNCQTINNQIFGTCSQ
jgi:hypothetical protein